MQEVNVNRREPAEPHRDPYRDPPLIVAPYLLAQLEQFELWVVPKQLQPAANHVVGREMVVSRVGRRVERRASGWRKLHEVAAAYHYASAEIVRTPRTLSASELQS